MLVRPWTVVPLNGPMYEPFFSSFPLLFGYFAFRCLRNPVETLFPPFAGTKCLFFFPTKKQAPYQNSPPLTHAFPSPLKGFLMQVIPPKENGALFPMIFPQPCPDTGHPLFFFSFFFSKARRGAPFLSPLPPLRGDPLFFSPLLRKDDKTEFTRKTARPFFPPSVWQSAPPPPFFRRPRKVFFPVGKRGVVFLDPQRSPFCPKGGWPPPFFCFLPGKWTGLLFL